MSPSIQELLGNLENDVFVIHQLGSAELPSALTDLSTQAEAHLTQIIGNFDQGANGLITSLDDADQWLLDAIAQIQGAVAHVHEKQSELQTACQQWEQENQQLIETCQNDAQQLGESLVALDQQLGSDHASIQSTLTALVAAVQGGIASLHQSASQLATEFGTFDAQSVSALQAVGQSLQTLSADLDNEFATTDHLLIAETNGTLERAQHLLQGTAEQLEQAAAGVHDALALFGEEGQRVGTMLDGSVGEVLDAIREVLRVLEQIRPLLDAIDQLI